MPEPVKQALSMPSAITHEEVETLQPLQSNNAGKSLPKYGWEEIGKHRQYNDCWIVVKGKVYDVTSWVPKHPGGKLILNGAGRESTALFTSYHPLNVQKRLTNYLIGEVDDYQPFYRWDGEFYPVLKSRVEKVLKEQGVVDNNSPLMYFKALSIALVWVVFYYLAVLKGSILATFALGFVHAQIGISISHDANHGAFSKYPLINSIASYGMDFMGGSSLVWLHQHNIGHHPNSNKEGTHAVDESEEIDPDSRSGTPWVRLSPEQPRWWLHAYQHIYIWFLFGLVSSKWFVNDIKSVARRRYATINFYEVTKGDDISLFLTKGFFLLYMVAVPFYLHSFGHALLMMTIFLLVSSYCFVLVFSVNHLTEGVTFPNDSTENRDWARLQIMTATNFALDSPFWTWITGGLNFQIEHHLFPGLCHIHLPKISPIVQQTCREYNVPYKAFPTYFHALHSHYKHLQQLGNPELYGEEKKQ